MVKCPFSGRSDQKLSPSRAIKSMKNQKKSKQPAFKRSGPRGSKPAESSADTEKKTSNEGLIYGRNTVLSYLENELKAEGSSINKIFLLGSAGSDPRLSKIESLARRLKIQVHSASREKLEDLVPDGGNHQGVAASLSPVELKNMNDLIDLIESEKEKVADQGGNMNGFTIVAVDGVEDPRNLGAIIRCAEAEGAKAVVIPERRATGVTEIVAKTSAGALAHIPIVRVTNMVRSIKELKEKGFWVLGMTPAAKDLIYRIDLKCPLVLVVGSEGKGMSRLVSENCDLLGAIPSLGKTESLNVSVALGIGLYEIVRQNHS